MKEAFGGLEFGSLTEMCSLSMGLGHKHKLKVIWRQHFHIILAAHSGFGEIKFSHIVQSYIGLII